MRINGLTLPISQSFAFAGGHEADDGKPFI